MYHSPAAAGVGIEYVEACDKSGTTFIVPWFAAFVKVTAAESVSTTGDGKIVSIKWPNSVSEGWSPVSKNAANSEFYFWAII